MTKEQELAKKRVQACIMRGKKNACTVKEISDLSGVPERTVKEMVSALRKEGKPIVSSSSGGYFLPDESDPDDIREAQRFVAMQCSQATERLTSCKPIKLWLSRLKQMAMEGA